MRAPVTSPSARSPRRGAGRCSNSVGRNWSWSCPTATRCWTWTTVELELLSDRRWVHYARSAGLSEVVDLCCATAGFAPRVAVRTSQVAAAPSFAAAGIGPALVPEHIVPAALRAPRSSRVATPGPSGLRIRS